MADLIFRPMVIILEVGNHMKSVLLLPLPSFQLSPHDAFQSLAEVCLKGPPLDAVFSFARSQL